jgi:hydroxyethylthiazole kinase-like uncharacterized protein yjeF
MDASLPTALYRAAQTRELDRLAIAGGIPGRTLMERAGAAAFGCLRRRWPQARRVALLCGAGNNAGDGYVVARLARQAGFVVRVFRPEGLRPPAGDAAAAREAALAAGVGEAVIGSEPLGDYDLLVDGLLGIGLDGPPRAPFAAAIAAANGAGRPVLALDIPSGLHADSGAVAGDAIRAELTVTFIGLKPGLLTGAGRACCGDIAFFDLGVPAGIYAQVPAAAERLDLARVADRLAPRPRDAHKGHFGHVLVVGGDHGMAGAVRLAAEAAARVGAGLVSVATRSAHAAVIAAARPELMCHGVESAGALRPLLGRASVVAVGPGLGRDRWGRQLLGALLDSGLPLVVDADGLNLLAGDPVARGEWVLTPHPAEAARLLGIGTAAVQADRFAALDALAARFDATVVLKGSGTLVGGRAGVGLCSGGNPGMASGGMGDLLTGTIAGLAAQGVPLTEAARLGVCLHAAAADRAARDGERGLLAADLLPHLRTLANRG